MKQDKKVATEVNQFLCRIREDATYWNEEVANLDETAYQLTRAAGLTLHWTGASEVTNSKPWLSIVAVWFADGTMDKYCRSTERDVGKFDINARLDDTRASEVD